MTSISEVEKVQKKLSLKLCPSERISAPGLKKAIANIEIVKELSLKVGDHFLFSIFDCRLSARRGQVHSIGACPKPCEALGRR